MKKEHTKKINISKNKNKFETATTTDNNVSNVIRILVIVLLVFFAVYFITAVVTGEIKFGDKKSTSTPAAIQYQEILVGEMFNRSEDNYYVLYMKFADADTSFLMQLSDKYAKSSNAIPVYYVDLEKAFNSIYDAGDGEANAIVDNFDGFKVKGPTLIRFENNKIVESIQGSELIQEYFNGLSK